MAKCFGLALISAISLSASGARAASEDTKLIAEKLQESRKGVVEAETQKRKILGSLYLINQRMKKISSDKSRLTNNLFQVQYNVKNIAKLIAGLEVQIEKQRTQLRRRLRALYKISGQGYISVVFSRGNASDLDETLRFLKIVTDADYQLIKSYQHNVVTYRAQREKLRGQIEKLVSIEKNIKKQENLLAAEHKAKSKIASELDREKVANIRRIKSLRDKSKELGGDSAELADLLKPSIYEQKGQLSAPIQGIVVQDFGLVMDDRYKIRLNHKGWKYESAPNAPVSPIFEGRVIHSEWVKGYGHTVILDHGDHYYSLYSHIARVKAKAGDTLKRGQVFAEAGVPGKDSVSGIYFEIRHFSEPENPAGWISKKQYRQASVAQLEDR